MKLTSSFRESLHSCPHCPSVCSKVLFEELMNQCVDLFYNDGVMPSVLLKCQAEVKASKDLYP